MDGEAFLGLFGACCPSALKSESVDKGEEMIHRSKMKFQETPSFILKP